MIRVRDPRTGRDERALCPPSREQLAELTAGLRRAQPAWQVLGAEGRADALRTWADALASATGLLEALVTDTGRGFESRMELEQVAAMARRWADTAGPLLAAESRHSAAFASIELETRAVAYPLVGVISPWNFPLLLGLIDAIPALAAGCAVVIKPSEVTPRFIAPLRATLTGVPALRDVVGIVEGAGDVGAGLIDLVDSVCFTGSVATGRLVGAAAAAAFIPAFLELGGKDPAIVLAGADLKRASSAVLWGSVANAGQSCLSIERIYVHEDIHDEFVGLLAGKARQVRLARPGPDDGQLGPLIDPAQAEIISRQLADAYEHGARALTGGEVQRHDGGLWIEPTVLTGVDHSMTVMRDETFGPVMPVMPVSGADEAVMLANDSEFGLSAAVFAADADTARAVAGRIRAGAVSINDAALTALVHEGEKNSFNYSGLGGSRMGPASIRRFVRKQTLIVNHAAARDPWWHTP